MGNTLSVLLKPHENPKPASLNNLGILFLTRFERHGDVADLDKAISVQDEAVRLTPDGHPDKPACLSNLGNSFLTRFQRLGDVADLDKAILGQDDAVRLTPDGHPGKPGFLNNLGISFRNRFKRLGDVADLDKAISVQDDAVRLTPDGHPYKPTCLSNFGNSFLTRLERHGDIADLDKAISVQDDAVRLTPDGHPYKPTCLSNFGNSFLTRLERHGDIADLDKAISVQGDAVRLTLDGHPGKPGFLNNLCGSFLRRFQRLGDVADVAKAISVQDDAVRLTPDGHPDKSACLSNLGNSFLTRFQRLGDVADLDKAISVQDDAVRLTPHGHPDKPGHLNNLGNSFFTRFERHGDVADLNKAILVQNDAVRLTPDSHSDKPRHLNNLGISFRTRFKRHEDVADLDKAISVQDDAVRLTPDRQPNKPDFLSKRGNSFSSRFERLGDIADLDKAIHQYTWAARSSVGPALVRFNAAQQWARLASTSNVHSSLEAYICALDLLPRVAWLGLPMAARHRELTSIGEVVRDPAAAAIASGEYGTALECLEQGRSIVWGQLLQLRSPVDDLRTQAPSLADRLDRVSKELESASAVNTADHQLSMEEVGQRHRQLASEWEKLVDDARAVPGFEDFLRPTRKRLSHLRCAARSGPVVVINAHKSRCDALVLMAELNDVIHIPLPDFSYDQAESLQQSLNAILSASGHRARASAWVLPDGRTQTIEDWKLKKMLSVLWLHVVKPVLESLAYPISRTADPPRIWWCATGPLAFLPLHAAGLYESAEPGSSIGDFVTFSYTPTLTALQDEPRSSRLTAFQLLAVAQPSTPNHNPLPKTKEELIRIRRCAGNLVKSLEGVEATVADVVQGMKDSNWLHLACHGTQDKDDPTRSALLLEDGRLELSEIIKTPLSNAEFAFLSACQTATGDTELAEEAVHLAGGMLLAGYRSVIATTWSILDDDAPLVADEVYSRLFKDHQPDPTQAAHALHHAVKRLRQQEGVSFLSWVPFIHIGL